MSGRLHDRLIDLFNDALEREGSAREAFLEERCEGDEELLREARSLLAAEGEIPDEGFLAASEGAPGAASLIGTNVGAYTVLEILGEGGMGVVYRAEQASPRRTVALKLVRPGVMGRDARRRFRYEAEVLGRLTHPGIAQIYEAGTADTPLGSCPFFAMELVVGRPLTAYADDAGLDFRARLELIAAVCDAVHHAHLNGVIHRDLKPGNILVDTAGRPRVLDFGVARAVESDVAAATMRTTVGELVGTLRYMSPEQCAGDPACLDTRSDIYTVGVVAWELLSGTLPYDLEDKPFPEVIRIIREEPPRSLRAFCDRCDRDVETIVAKAIQKEPGARYASAAGLAADIRRSLRDEPIVARPPTTLYQVSRFARRNRMLVASVLAVFVTLVLAVLVSVSQNVKTQAALELARANITGQVNAARALQDYLNAILRQDPADFPAFAEMASSLEGSRGGHFAIALHERVGDAYTRQGRYDLATQHLAHARRLSAAHWEPGSGRDLRSVTLVADNHRRCGALEVARSLVVAGLEAAGYVPGHASGYAVDPDRSTIALRCLGLQLVRGDIERDAGHLDLAEAILRRNVADAKTLLKPSFDRDIAMRAVTTIEEQPIVTMSRRSLATVLIARGEPAEAEAILRDLIEFERRHESPDAFVLRWMQQQLGAALLDQGKLAEADALLVDAGRTLASEWGGDSLDALHAAALLGRLRHAQGRLAEADDLLASVVEAGTARYRDHWRTAAFGVEYGVVLAARGRADDAHTTLAAARERLDALFGPDDARTRRASDAIAGLDGTASSGPGSRYHAEPEEHRHDG